MEQLFEAEIMTGDNKVVCESEICQGTKTDSRKGIKIDRLPPVLTFCLNRFELDFETWQRKKIDDRFEYPLELDMDMFLSEQRKKDLKPEDAKYELKSIVIHRGGAYGGHYWAYIKDDFKEGHWHLEKNEKFAEKPKEVNKKKFDATEFMTEEQKKELEDEKNKNNPNYQKGGKKNKNKNKNKNKKKDNDKPKESNEVAEYDYSLCDFPIAYSESRLVENWFEFNDATVSPIRPGDL